MDTVRGWVIVRETLLLMVPWDGGGEGELDLGEEEAETGPGVLGAGTGALMSRFTSAVREACGG